MNTTQSVQSQTRPVLSSSVSSDREEGVQLFSQLGAELLKAREEFDAIIAYHYEGIAKGRAFSLEYLSKTTHRILQLGDEARIRIDQYRLFLQMQESMFQYAESLTNGSPNAFSKDMQNPQMQHDRMVAAENLYFEDFLLQKTHGFFWGGLFPQFEQYYSPVDESSERPSLTMH